MDVRKEVLKIIKLLIILGNPVDELLDAYALQEIDLTDKDYYTYRQIQTALDDICLDLQVVPELFNNLSQSSKRVLGIAVEDDCYETQRNIN